MNIETIEDLSEFVKISDIKQISELIAFEEIDLSIYESWLDIGFDELDMVEFIMILEKIINKKISDDLGELINEIGPKEFLSILKRYQRNIKINKVLKNG